MMIWARRFVIGTGLAVASVVVVPGLAGAAGTGCTTAGPTVQPSMSTPPNCPIVPPTVSANQTTAGTASLPNTGAAATGSSNTTSGSSTLPFTGADVEELAVIGGVALLAGGLLMRRRRSTVSI